MEIEITRLATTHALEAVRAAVEAVFPHAEVRVLRPATGITYVAVHTRSSHHPNFNTSEFVIAAVAAIPHRRLAA